MSEVPVYSSTGPKSFGPHSLPPFLGRATTAWFASAKHQVANSKDEQLKESERKRVTVVHLGRSTCHAVCGQGDLSTRIPDGRVRSSQRNRKN